MMRVRKLIIERKGKECLELRRLWQAGIEKLGTGKETDRLMGWQVPDSLSTMRPGGRFILFIAFSMRIFS